MHTQPAPVIWLNGFPGAGKLTVAERLAEIFGEEALLIDSHQLIDVVTLPRDHPEYRAKRKAVRALAFQKYVYSKETLGRAVIFTDFQASDEAGAAVAGEYREAAEKVGRPFVPVYITCEIEENIRRVNSLERITSGKEKMLQPEVVRDWIKTYQLFRYPNCNGISVDTTILSPKETAMLIFKHVQKETQPN